MKVYRAIGLMSGTSMDGVDAAFLETDGHDFVRPGGFLSVPYGPGIRGKIRACLGKPEGDAETARFITEKHIEVVKALAAQEEIDLAGVDVVGFHGQTVYHSPAQKMTVQIGDAEMMAKGLGVPVVFDFRSADVAAGGQGAPLLPLYHRARVMADGLEGPVAILNIGGVANVTWISGEEILAFDTGPGNALIDDWVRSHGGGDYDKDGMLAGGGTIDKALLETLLSDKYFSIKPPKSLDRDHFAFSLHSPQGEEGRGEEALSLEDGAATLAAFTVESVKRGFEFFPSRPRQWLMGGGGRHNKFLMDYLRVTLKAPVNPVEQQGWNGDALEAEGFAYLAVRSLLGKALSLPSTTGVPEPLTGGVLFKP